MSALPKRPQRESLTIRILPEDRGLIDQAAKISGRNRTDFILDAARRAAEEALLDRTSFVLDADAFAAFVARLDEPPRSNERLRRLMQTPDPWDVVE
jgi:uncharacterized protein (DUF1778 family)